MHLRLLVCCASARPAQMILNLQLSVAPDSALHKMARRSREAIAAALSRLRKGGDVHRVCAILHTGMCLLVC